MVSLTHGFGEGAWRIRLCRAKENTIRIEKDVWGDVVETMREK
jgi:hypothetical protein